MSSSFHQSDLDLCYRRLSQSPNASVISWLDQCPYPTSPDQFDLTLDEQFFEVSETEPITAMYSPAKRPRNEGSDEGSGFTIARTPPPPIRRRPDLTRSPLTVPITTGVDESSQAPSSPRTSQNRSTGSNSRQQKTAVKKVLHLCSLDTPVRYRPSDEEALPIAIKALAQTIAAVSDSPGGILPNQTKGQDVQHPENKKDVADLFSKHVHAVLMEIVSATKEALVWNRSEAAWNLLVHYPMLKLAISGLPDVDVELITAAQILPAFLPKFTPPTTTRSTSKTSAEAVTSQGKMVDLALLLSPKRISSSILAAAMDAILPTLPLDECCLSQTDYGPLSVYPAPVAIETKTANGSMEEARIQLGIWTSAWFLRMHKLMREPKTAVVAVPVIMVQGPWWFAYFACETEQGIVLYGPQRLGETNTNYGIYTLFACLKSIGEWLDGPFKQWFAREILGLAKLD